MGRSDAKYALQQRQEIRAGHGAVTQDIHVVIEIGFDFCKTWMIDCEIDFFADFTGQVCVFETDDVVGKDHAVPADFAVHADVKCQRPQSVIAVCHPDERAECLGTVLRGYKGEVESGGVMRQVNIAIAAAEWRVAGGHLPFARFGLRKGKAAALVRPVQRHTVGHQPVVPAHNAQHAAAFSVHERLFAMHGPRMAT